MYKYLNELNIDKENVVCVRFFRHNGLYMCHAYYHEPIEFDKSIDFYLTEKNVFITKKQARQRLQVLFPNAKIIKYVVSRNSCKYR